MNPIKKAFQFAWIAALGIMTLAACSGGSDRDAKTAASALINENKNIVAFGHVSVQQLLDKLDYQHLPKVNALVGGELQSWKGGIDPSKPIYFAVQAPFGEDGSPELTYILMDVKNKDSLVGKFTGMGYAVEKSGDIECFREGDVAVGIRNSLAIVLIKGGDFDYKALLETSFKQTEGEESEGKTHEILAANGDMVTGMSIERLYTSSNTSLSKLSEAKKKELLDMTADGFVKTTVNFEKGRMVVKTDNLFSEKLKDRLFFKEDATASVLKKLGTGNAWMGISGNIDMRKVESFINDFAPEAQAKITEIMPGQVSMAFAMMGDSPFAKMFSGQFGFVAIGNPKSAVGMEPQFNFYLGLGSKGDFITQKFKEYAPLLQFQQKGSAYITGNMAIEPKSDGLYGYTVGTPETTLMIPSFAKDFGKKTFSMFIDFGAMDVTSLELEDEWKVLEIMDSFVINADRNGGEMILTTKDGSSNILKQVGIFYSRMLEERMGGMAI